MRNLLSATAIMIAATTGFALAQGTSGVTPEEELRMELQDSVTTGGVNSDGVRDVDQRPSRSLIDTLNGNVQDNNPMFMNNDCVEQSANRPNIEVTRDLAGTEKDITNPC